MCQPKCNKYPGQKCPAALPRMCEPNTCVCVDGYARVADDKCVEKDSDECGGVHDPTNDLHVIFSIK